MVGYESPLRFIYMLLTLKGPRSRVLQEQLPVKAQRLPSWPAQPIPLLRTTSSLDEPGGCGCKVELLALSVLELGISCFEVLNWDTFSGVVFRRIHFHLLF